MPVYYVHLAKTQCSLIQQTCNESYLHEDLIFSYLDCFWDVLIQFYGIKKKKEQINK